MLSVNTPEMLGTGQYTKEHVGLLSSVYLFVYAAGQLVNGIIGDMINPRKMVTGGLLISGIVMILFPFVGSVPLQFVIFGLMGFALSMLRGPLVKTISENTTTEHARNICVFFSVSSFVGPLVASMIAAIFNWRLTFLVAGGVTVLIGIGAYIMLLALEKQGLVKFSGDKVKGFSGVKKVFGLEKFKFYMFVGMLVEISAASISFWIPTYLTERLSFSEQSAGFIFSAMSFLRAMMPFVGLMLYRKTGKKDVLMIRYAFLSGTLFFVVMLFISNPVLNIITMLVALMSVSVASCMLWSIYIPGLGKCGVVSSVNGILDCAGYIAAALANMVFALIMDKIDWNGIIIIWAGLLLAGVVSTFFCKKNK